MYQGTTYLGSNKFSALYGLNDTIVDQKAIGIQHLYIDNYKTDLIHTACSVVTHKDTAFFGNRMKPIVGHPSHKNSSISSVEEHCIMTDQFMYNDFSKTDKIGAGENYIYFETAVTNITESNQKFKMSSLVITHNLINSKVTKLDDYIIFEAEDKFLAIVLEKCDYTNISLDAPSGFMYHGIEDILYNKNRYAKSISTTLPVSVSLNYDIELTKYESAYLRWAIIIGSSYNEIVDSLHMFSFDQPLNKIKKYWKDWLSIAKKVDNFQDEVFTALVALKGALLDGFLPADLTGHYFANGKVSFYVRDALMGARSFLYSGFYDEFESIILFLVRCKLKDTGEFYQRYNSSLYPDEGANNNVFSQIDTIGYFSRVVADYFILTKKMIVSFEYLAYIIQVLFSSKTKNGLLGPEGGVNEGVYGPAFIISTNMFIVGGLYGAIEIAKSLHKEEYISKWNDMALKIQNAIESTFLTEGYFPYGYVDYHDEIIKKYDTPQLLSVTLGYPLTKNYKHNFETLMRKATFFEYGMGYSEQEYHHGPWIFNTAASAEVAFLSGEIDIYKKIMAWMINHRNSYGLLPEAIDASNENICYINPLMWANAEFICAVYVKQIMKMRKN